MAIIICCGHNTNITPWKKTDKPVTDAYSYGIGIVINLKNDLYVLTCAHVILKSTYKLIMYRYTSNKLEEILLDVVCVADVLDLALLKLKTKSSATAVNLCDFDKSILFDDDNIASLNALSYELDKTKKKIIEQKYDCKVTNVKIQNIRYLNMPLLPWIEIIIKDDIIYNSEKLDGLSGSSIFINDKIIGIISCYELDPKKIILTPRILIHRFIREFITTNEYNGLCNIIASTTNSEIEINEKKYDGVQIENDYNINYNYNKKSYMKTRRNLKKNDVIYEINNKKFKEIDGNMLLYDDNLSMNIPMSTYIALNYIVGDEIDLKIYRPSDTNKNLKINARSVKTTMYLPITHNYSYHNCNGLIFVELSKYMIEHYIDQNIGLYNIIGKYIFETPYRNNNDKIIVLVDIIKNEMSDSIFTEMNNIV